MIAFSATLDPKSGACCDSTTIATNIIDIVTAIFAVPRCMLYTADGRRMGKQTKSKRGFNPYFNEEFKFRNLVRSDIRGGHLVFSVVQKNKKNIVGVGIIPGCRINLDRDEAHNIPICSKIQNQFVYNMEDITREPESLIRIIYPKSSDHIEVYQ
ncbi:unnamed protein product [Taenia asiatica]|uniref:C2 domain-containing protein n=1 Tax=Taenia asiatica TaxID=60517 RepID=A0A0R3WD00_TAEAS|nr:unnamed protein product [Taenia asiatica]